MQKIFAPGLKLLNHLSFKKKFIIIFIVIGIPITALFFNYLQELNKEIVISKEEQKGLVYVNKLSVLMKNTQQHRGLSVGYINGEVALKDSLQEKQQEIAGVFDGLETLLQADKDAFSIQGDLQAIKNSWQEVSTEFYHYNAPQSFQKHTELISTQLDLLAKLADHSKLTVDHELANKYLISLITDKLPRITEYLGEARAIGTGIASKGHKSDDDQMLLLFSKQSLQIYRHDVQRIIQSIHLLNDPVVSNIESQAQRMLQEVEAIGTYINDNMIGSRKITINPQDYFQLVTSSIDEVYNFMDSATLILEKRLNDRINELKVSRAGAIVLTLAAGTISMYLFLSFYIGVQNNISTVKNVTEKIAEGDLTKRIIISSKDEFQFISNSINEMVAAFNKIVASNQEIAEEVSMSTTDLALVTEETAKATEQITMAMEDISSIMEQQMINAKNSERTLQNLSENVVTIANSSSNVSKSSQFMATEAQKGNETVARTIKQMGTIQHAVSNTEEIIDRLNLRSSNISNIVTMITAIADQTNLLALNAAIEAARAGEAGKGFAVVADEVRKLAENSSNAANNIQSLIKETLSDTKQAIEAMKSVSQETEAGISDVENTKEMFKSIAKSTGDVVAGIKAVATLSSEITTKLEDLMAALNSVAKLSIQAEGNTQQVAAATEEQLASMEEISSTVTSLNEKAIKLEQQIDRFKV